MSDYLTINHLSYAYHTPQAETPALQDISFCVKKNEFVAVIGPSGCGKSTLLNIICGLLSPDEGTVKINSEGHPCNCTNIGYMLQRDHLFEWRTIFSNVSLGLEIQNKMTPRSRSELYSMLNEYGLEDFANAKPPQLSGGMRQRAALIRTLALAPELLLLDEPFSALDYQTRIQVCNDIYTIIKNENKTAVLITHDLSEAISVGDRVIVLSGRPATVKNIIPMKFPPEENTPLLRRNSCMFSKYFNLLWRELHE